VLLGAPGEPRPGRRAGRRKLLLEPDDLDHAARPRGLRGGPGQIERDQREARFQRDLGGAQRLHRIERPRPEEPAQIDPAPPWVERVRRIDQRAQLAGPGGGGQGGMEQRRPSRAGRRDDLVQLPPREPPAQRRVELLDARCEGPRGAQRERRRPPHLPGPQQVLERTGILRKPARGQRHTGSI